MSRLVVVSNRVAPVNEGQAAAGGLAVGVLSALRESGGIWFGWSGEVASTESAEPSVFQTGRLTYATVDLTQEDYDQYYAGYANGTLWPLCHYRVDLAQFSRRAYAGYERVNTLFAKRLRPLLRDDDRIWVHDYHLIPLGRELRQAGVEAPIGFFLHIPWPALEILLTLPNHAQIVRAMCDYDLVGLQTPGDVRAFCDYIRWEAKGEVGADGTVRAYGRTLRVAAFPIGIDVEAVQSQAEVSGRSRQAQRLRDSLADRSLFIGVDRLDYSKGLVNRFEAYERLLETYADIRGQLTFLQIAPPSRSDVPSYIEIRRTLEQAAGHINGRFAEYDWVPLRYLNKSFSRKMLLGFLRSANVALVTPLRDGMNLVAKEFVAAQDPEDPGVLVLSRFAGAAAELNSALIINPFDTDGVAEAMRRALDMPRQERIARWQDMMRALKDYDIAAWRDRFVAALERVHG
ncbi:MAG: alpha,alpha-trehalose-phosphate synthase (UDP-forming) [Alphaproteobacteria bacterium]